MDYLTVFGIFVILAIIVLSVLYFLSPETLGIKPSTESLAEYIASSKKIATAAAAAAETATSNVNVEAAAIKAISDAVLDDIRISNESVNTLTQLMGVSVAKEQATILADAGIEAAKVYLAARNSEVAAADALAAATNARIAANTIATTQITANEAKTTAEKAKDIAIRQAKYVSTQKTIATETAKVVADAKAKIQNTLQLANTSIASSAPAGYTVITNTLFTSPTGYTPANYVIGSVGTSTARASLETCKATCDSMPTCNAIAYEAGTCYFQAIPTAGYIAESNKATFLTYLKGDNLVAPVVRY